jgi:peptidoglycan/LPS O-acetylase OafA/YrhL
MTEGPANQDRRIADIEVLRAVAVILVMVQHAPAVLFPWRGEFQGRLYSHFGFWPGVDVFLAISGFVIARSLLPSLESARGLVDSINITLAFWVRRIWRLLPSAWLWLALILLLVLCFNRSGAFGTFRGNFEATVAAILNVANFRALLVFGQPEQGVSFPYWSLSLGVQFYILLPIAFLLAGRRLPAVLILGVLTQLFLPRFGPGTSAIGNLLNVIRSDALMLGVLIALWSRTTTYRLFEPAGLRRTPIVGVLALAVLTGLLVTAGSPVLHLGGFNVGLVAILSGALVFIASYDGDYLFPPGRLKNLLLWIGARSYALYLIHEPAYLMAREIWFRIEPPGTVFTGIYTLRFTVTALTILFILADLNHRLVETPLRRRGARIAARLKARTA